MICKLTHMIIIALAFISHLRFAVANLGSCKNVPEFTEDFNGPTFPVDITIDPIKVENIKKYYIIDELVVVKDFSFDTKQINYIAAIELLHEANCTNQCQKIEEMREPWRCNKYIFDVSLIGYYNKPIDYNESVVRILRDEISRFKPYVNHNEFGDPNSSTILARFNPADRFISFRTPFDQDFYGGYLKLGNRSKSPFVYGRIVVRFAFIDEYHDFMKDKTHFTTIPVKMRFHTLIPERTNCLTQTGMTTFANFETKGRPESYLYFSNGPQSASIGIPEETISSLLTINNANILKIMGLSVVGFNWMLSYTVEFFFKDAVIYTVTETDYNFWNSQSLMPLSEQVFLTNGTSIHFTCSYDSTKHPFIDVPKTTLRTHKIPIGPNPQYAPCMLHLQFSDANCANQVVYDKNWFVTPCSNVTTSAEHRCK